MIGYGSSDGRHKNSRALADVTNQLDKRRVLSISSSPDLEKGNGFRDNMEGKVPDSEFVQKVCLGVENLVRGKCKRGCVEDANAKGLPLAKPIRLCSLLKSGSGRDFLNGDRVSGISGVHIEIKDLPGGMHFVRGNAAKCRIQEGSDRWRNCRTFGVSELGGSEQCDRSGSSTSVIVGGGSQGDTEGVKANVRGDAIGSTLENDVLDAHVCGNDCELMDGGELTSTKTNLSGSSSSKCSELEICAGSGSAEGSSADHGADMLNVCSCSFCLKAAYIWSDLHYQDVLGRIAALKKSGKEVKFYVDRSLNQYETDRNGMANLNKSKKLELDLMGQWKSLFFHTEDILIRESTQLESSLLSLKELRRNCKMEVEMTNRMPLNK
ncbi:hypothetical protein NE237_028347 [Protea cynaroides]|uniref:Uncharacterized protein n=1 Tax=Protea cynaroides TaxID=273540 RepID=A0A9Q0JV17_9MAGN|nr:hypothetical protein NE237_028347 [Protea cynaroides]